MSQATKILISQVDAHILIHDENTDESNISQAHLANTDSSPIESHAMYDLEARIKGPISWNVQVTKTVS